MNQNTPNQENNLENKPKMPIFFQFMSFFCVFSSFFSIKIFVINRKMIIRHAPKSLCGEKLAPANEDRIAPRKIYGVSPPAADKRARASGVVEKSISRVPSRSEKTPNARARRLCAISSLFDIPTADEERLFLLPNESPPLPFFALPAEADAPVGTSLLTLPIFLCFSIFNVLSSL